MQGQVANSAAGVSRDAVSCSRTRQREPARDQEPAVVGWLKAGLSSTHSYIHDTQLLLFFTTASTIMSVLSTHRLLYTYCASHTFCNMGKCSSRMMLKNLSINGPFSQQPYRHETAAERRCK